MEQGSRVCFITSWEIPDGSSLLSELPSTRLPAGRYILGVSDLAHAVKMIGELKAIHEVAMAFIPGQESFDYINNETYYGSVTSASIATTYLVRVGTLGAELEEVKPNQFTVNSPHLTAAAKEHARIWKWSSAVELMISDIKIKLSGTGESRRQESKAATIKVLLNETLLRLSLITHIKGNSTAKLKIEELVGLLDGIIEKNPYKPLVQINILLKNVLFCCEESKVVEATGEIES